MNRNARIEEVFSSSDEASDSDPDIMDPDSLAVLEPVRRTPAPTPAQQQQQHKPGSSFPAIPRQQQPPPLPIETPQLDSTWVTLYPLYFDASATRQQGRRVGKADAVRNPLAKGLADAAASVATLGNGRSQSVVLEPGKRHPADWANPGRVKVKVKDEKGRWSCAGGIKNKRMLYKAVAQHLKKHPTTKDDPFSLPLRGLPMPEDGVMPPPAVPRGWRLNEILPLHSAALTGGGVSDNIMKDIQAAMAGQNPALAGMVDAAAAASSGPQGRIEPAKKKKEKGKKK